MFCTSLFLLSWVVCTHFTFVVDAVPYTSAVAPRDAIATATPIISASARIQDRNGIDVSSLFQVKVYHHASSARISNITEENNLNDRQVESSFITVIDSCPGNETFIESHCTPRDNEEASLQAYGFTCRQIVNHWRAITGEYLGMVPAYRTRNGHCKPMEVCVDGFASKRIASCVHNSLFDDYMIDKDGNIKGMLSGEIFDVSKAYAVLSKKDLSTPMETDSMGIGSWVASSSLAKGSVQTKTCRDCVELETDTLQPTPDSFKLEATLLSTGAMAGILWLFLASG